MKELCRSFVPSLLLYSTRITLGVLHHSSIEEASTTQELLVVKVPFYLAWPYTRFCQLSEGRYPVASIMSGKSPLFSVVYPPFVHFVPHFVWGLLFLVQERVSQQPLQVVVGKLV